MELGSKQSGKWSERQWFCLRSFGMILWLDLALTAASASSGKSPLIPPSLKVDPWILRMRIVPCFLPFLGWLLLLLVSDLDGEGSKGSLSMPNSPATPTTPVTPTTPLTAARKDNVWRSVFNPGRNLATKTIGAEVFDKPQPNSPTVYDWYVPPLSTLPTGRSIIKPLKS